MTDSWAGLFLASLVKSQVPAVKITCGCQQVKGILIHPLKNWVIIVIVFYIKKYNPEKLVWTLIFG